MSSQVELLRKFTDKNVMGSDIGRLVKAKGLQVDEEMELYALTGTISGYKMVPSPYGESPKFHGEFVAKRLTDGVVKAARDCFIREPMETHILSALSENVNPDTGEISPIELAIKVGVRRVKDDEMNNIKYEYTCVPLLAPTLDTMMTKRLDVLNGLLEPPKKPEAPKVSQSPEKKAKQPA